MVDVPLVVLPLSKLHMESQICLHLLKILARYYLPDH